MIRQLWFGYMNAVDRVEGERWYFRFHGPEFARWFGPWMRRYETFRALDPPPEAKRYGALPGMYTEMWWPSLEEYRDAAPFAKPYTLGAWLVKLSVDGIVAAVPITPAKPTEDFLGKEPNPEGHILRWVRVFRYPQGVSREEGDKWYLGTYSPQVKQQAGLTRYIGYKVLDDPSVRAAMGAYGQWHRVEELWYEDMAAWRKANVESSLVYTPPPWGGQEPFVQMVSDFVRIRPDADFLKGNAVIP